MKNIKENTKQLIKEILKRGFITEAETNLIKNRMNHKKINYEDIQDLFKSGNGIKITPEQTEKGLSWLKDKWKTPRGIERKNNPFGYREEEALETFKEFKLVDFHNNVNYYQSELEIFNFIPVWVVIGKKSNFQYYVEMGEPKIIG